MKNAVTNPESSSSENRDEFEHLKEHGHVGPSATENDTEQTFVQNLSQKHDNIVNSNHVDTYPKTDDNDGNTEAPSNVLTRDDNDTPVKDSEKFHENNKDSYTANQYDTEDGEEHRNFSDSAQNEMGSHILTQDRTEDDKENDITHHQPLDTNNALENVGADKELFQEEEDSVTRYDGLNFHNNSNQANDSIDISNTDHSTTEDNKNKEQDNSNAREWQPHHSIMEEEKARDGVNLDAQNEASSKEKYEDKYNTLDREPELETLAQETENNSTDFQTPVHRETVRDDEVLKDDLELDSETPIEKEKNSDTSYSHTEPHFNTDEEKSHDEGNLYPRDDMTIDSADKPSEFSSNHTLESDDSTRLDSKILEDTKISPASAANDTDKLNNQETDDNTHSIDTEPLLEDEKYSVSGESEIDKKTTEITTDEDTYRFNNEWNDNQSVVKPDDEITPTPLKTDDENATDNTLIHPKESEIHYDNEYFHDEIFSLNRSDTHNENQSRYEKEKGKPANDLDNVQEEEEESFDDLSPGTILYQTRKKQKMSVKQAADRLYLDVHVVEALEADDYETLPPTIFVRGYLRNYAKLLGISTKSIMTSFDKLQQPTIVPIFTPPTKQKKQASSRDLGPTLVTFAIIITLILGVSLWQFFPKTTPDAQLLNPNTPEEAFLPLIEGIEDKDSLTVGEEVDSNQLGEESTNNVTNDSSNLDETLSTNSDNEVNTTPEPALQTMQVRFKERAWVKITDKVGTKLYEGIGNAGEILPLEGTQPFYLQVGNIDGVSVEYNGEIKDIRDYSKHRRRSRTYIVGNNQ